MVIVKVEIDIIIPEYNAKDTVVKTLFSIASQTIADKVLVTIVDDCSTDGSYEYLRTRYFYGVNVNVIQTPKNGGPGVARQYGIDHTSCQYIVFVDADDTLGDSLSLEALYADIKECEQACMVVGSFDEECPEEIRPHKNDMVWMHGKMYRRSFLERYNIRFHPTSRANEDNGFNTIIKLIVALDPKWKIAVEDRCVYIWHNIANSMTRKNDYEYYFGASFPGFVENMIYVSRFIIKLHGEDVIKQPYYVNWCATVMCFLYAYYSECCRYAQSYAKANLIASKSFYNLVYVNVDKLVNVEKFTRIYTNTMTASYKRFPTYIPTRTIFDFINDLKETI